MPKLLLVKDNEMNRDMLSRRLSGQGFEIVCAKDGQEGLGMARTVCPDHVLVDLSLPVMNGWEALRQLRLDPQTVRLPVIALTAHALVTDRDNTLDAGFDDYESKPIHFGRLVEKISRFVTPGLSDDTR